MPDMKIGLVSWTVPDVVTAQMPTGKREDGFKPAPSWKFEEVDADVLSRMCDDFRSGVFSKAGKLDPKFMEQETKPCRVCGGGGFIAEKRFIDDGAGEVDSCPACAPKAMD